MDNVQELTSEQTDKLLQFQDLTGIEQIQRCRDILQAHEWNIEAAVQDTFNEQEGAPTVFHRSSGFEERAPQIVLRPSNQRVYLFPGRRPQSLFEWTYYLLTMPIRFVWTTFFDIFRAFFSLLRSDARRLVTDPVGDVTSFISSFESKYGHQHPVFYQGTYIQALNDAKRELRFLLVYLHSEEQPSIDHFCREILCNGTFVNFVNSRMLFWSCSTNRPEGYQVSQALREHAYPFLAVIVLRDNKMSVVARIEGHVTGVQELIDQLEQVMTENELSLVTARADRATRSFNQSLRQQQDEAYLQSLQADQEKEKRRREEYEKLIHEEMKKQQEKEVKDLQFLEREQMKSDLERQLPPEPEPHHPDSVCVVLKIPNGSRIERRFLKHQSLKWLFYYVFCHKDCPDDFQIMSNFPRRILPCQPAVGQKDPPTFQEFGLGKSEMLFVHDNQA